MRPSLLKPAPLRVEPQTLRFGDADELELAPDPHAGPGKSLHTDGSAHFEGQSLVSRFRVTDLLVASDTGIGDCADDWPEGAPVLWGEGATCMLSQRDVDAGERLRGSVSPVALLSQVHMAALGLWAETRRRTGVDQFLHEEGRFLRFDPNYIQVRRTILPMQAEGTDSMEVAPHALHLQMQPCSPFRGQRLIVECRDSAGIEGVAVVDARASQATE
jgi:hypothetical protein